VKRPQREADQSPLSDFEPNAYPSWRGAYTQEHCFIISIGMRNLYDNILSNK